MSDDTLGFFRNLAGYATARLSYAKDRWLADAPKTYYSAGAKSQYQWQGQAVDREELEKVKQIRETGGMVSQLYHAKALIRFGTGAELQSDNDDLQAALNDDLFPSLDNLVLDLGEDAIWYPYALAEPIETNGSGFSHYECVEPWTTVPKTDPHGEIIAWEHEVGREYSDTFMPDELAHITINKSSGRDTVGISDVLRSQDEIEQYKENQQAINHAIELAGFPHNVWQVGAEGKAPVSDNELRRVRNIVEDPSGDTQWVMGADIDIDQIQPGQFDFQAITERDLRMLTGAIGLPFELVGYGSDGLGSGHEADLKLKLLAIQNEADRRRFAEQFVDRFVRPVVEQYTPYSADEDIRLHIAPFLDEKSEMADLINSVGDYMRTDEVRERLDLPPLEDDEMADSWRPPQQVEEAEEGPEDAGGFGGGGGFFSDGRALQGVPDNARPISDESECDGSVVRGPRGGMYCVPSGEDGDGQAPSGDGAEIPIEEVESGDEVQVDATIPGPDGDPVDISGDTVGVLDVDPNYGLLIDHPDFGRGEVPVDDIGSITDPAAEADTDTPTDGPSDSVDGLDLDDTVNEQETILSDEQKEAVAERITDTHGEAGEEALGLSNAWRQNSISGAAETLAAGLKAVGDLDGDVRDSGRDAADPTDEQLAAIGDMRSMSQDFFDERFDGETELVRGTRRNGRDDFLESFFAGEDSVEINANATDNYTSEDELAQAYAGDDGLLLRPTVTSEDVQLANASLFAEGFEDAGDEYLIDSPDEIDIADAEIRIDGQDIRVSRDPNDMDADEVSAVANAIEDPNPETQAAIDEWVSQYEGDL